MWNAFGNGSGLQGGGSGYVSKAQGWEFVPCSGLERETDRGRGTSRSPLRTLSPPSSDGHFYEQTLPGLGAAAPPDAPRGQALRQEHPQHSRLKKKFEDFKKRYGQDKDEWMREKEILLREVADIQGGENRRILLDLKSVLEEVQLEVKKEETKRSELQLQYTKDRCAWELERAELKCRIAQLEARGRAPSAEAARSPEPGETLKREQEEQKRLLADTREAAMALRCRVEHSERGWARERAEMLERFDSERREWESQLRDMQGKIQELYNEVRASREGGDVGPNAETPGGAVRLSLRSASTRSSVLTDRSDAHSSSFSDPSDQRSDGSSDAAGRRHGNDPGERPGGDRGEPADRRGGGRREAAEGEAIDTAELEELLQGRLGRGREDDASPASQEGLLSPFRGFQSMEIHCGSDKKKNTAALNAALKEIARVSEELCSYQDEVRRRPEIKRSRTDSLFFPEEFERVENVKNKAEMGDTAFSLDQWCKDLQAHNEPCWLSWEGISKEPKKMANIALNTEANIPLKKRQAPPIPPRSTSWYTSSPASPEAELNVLEPPIDRKCHSPCIHADRRCNSPCVHMDRKCNSPSVVRKFEAMLQENEGKILTASGIVPADSKCNIGCCQSRWSCDGSRFGSGKSSTYVPVQKCLSDVNMLAAGVDCSQDHKAADNQKGPGGKLQPAGRDLTGKRLPADSATPSPGVAPPLSAARAPRRNETLEQKTAEFNRTLFQAEMGRGQLGDGANSPDAPSNDGSDWAQQYPEVRYREPDIELPAQCPEVKLEEVLSDLVAQCPEVSYPAPHYTEIKAKEATFELQQLYQEVKPKEVTSDLPPQYPVVRLRESTSHSPQNYPEVIPRLRTPYHQSAHMRERDVKPLSPEGSRSTVAQVEPSASPAQVEHRAEKPGAAKPGASAQRPAETRSSQPGRPKRDMPNPRPRVLSDSPWKPTTLAALPRPADSRSNYGAVERILKSYEGAGRSQQHQQQQPSPGKEEDLIELLDMLDIEQLSRPGQRLAHTPHRQAAHKETHVTVQQSKESITIKKSFSRPACPANRRLPSRWASRSPYSSSTSSLSSPSPITQALASAQRQSLSPSPVAQASLSTQKQTFFYSAYHTETVII